MTRIELRHWRPGPTRALVDRRAAAWLGGATALAWSDARRRAPVRTGRLRASIIPLPARGRGGRARAGLHAQAPYALWVEIGTRRMRAQPYLRPTLTTIAAASPVLLQRIRGGIT